MGYENILFEVDGAVARITINRPPHNVLDIQTMREINEAIEEAQRVPGLKALVVGAAGDRAFSAGVDVRDHTPEKMDEMIEVFHRIFRLLAACPIPTIAVVSGMALGGGCEVAAFCDMVIASDRASFGQPEIKVGVYPSMAVAWFHRVIGLKKSYELLLTGETISAVEAERIGLVNQVVPHEELDLAVRRFLSHLTDKSSAVLKWAKTAMRHGMGVEFERGLEASEIIYKHGLMETEDAKEGISAFLEKRKPVWKER
ncbi:MAG: enoyl-CoA hydratase/isomerase family protein [Deltaproteobacteria bacterium]|nr:enoyl-CoA hydratase/isomerase family protein [Deltaproteobacteria bacterium]MBW2121468.1 enoyl-CoA hydratase/isomerase family protein [Deltaproteobacteria bacterium]